MPSRQSIPTLLCGGSRFSSVSALYALKSGRREPNYSAALKRLRRALGPAKYALLKMRYERELDHDRQAELRLLQEVFKQVGDKLPIVEVDYASRRMSRLARQLKRKRVLKDAQKIRSKIRRRVRS